MNVIRSEWTKLRSVRSTWIMAASTIFAGAALSVLGVSDDLDILPSDLPDGWDPTAISLKGFLFAQLLVGMLGAISITSEYSTGMIGSSLSVVPSRSHLLAAKMAVVALVALGTSLATTVVSFSAVQAILSNAGLPAASVGDPGVARALLGGSLFLMLVALVGLTVGVLTRSTTGSLATLIGATLLTPAIAPGLPGAVGDWFARYWPTTAGQAVYKVVPVEGMVGPWWGLAILVATAAIFLLVSHIVLRIRDI
jgi:ABC-type transport system involved in multi-copper enzyme maturation permease subunit